MAKWKRRRSRTRAAGLNRYFSLQGHMIRPWEGDGDDGATAGGQGGDGAGCDQPVAASAALASCAAKLLEAGDASPGEEGGTG
jgi:hypothetical protein